MGFVVIEVSHPKIKVDGPNVTHIQLGPNTLTKVEVKGLMPNVDATNYYTKDEVDGLMDSFSGRGCEHNQISGAPVWTIIHNLGYKPGGIVVEDSAHNDVFGYHVNHIDDTTLTLTFSVFFSGYAYLS
jgi:hypothetical protein